MNDRQLQSIRRHFHAYAKEYMARAGSMIHMMELKRTHCAFVARNCRELAVTEGWDQEAINTAEALGFMHDIGRFPQLEEYGTFEDSKSINHGERGHQAIIESDLLNEMEADRRAAVLNAVRHHNARVMPEDLPEAHYRYLKLIRDADRLDIYRVVIEAFESGKMEEHPEIGLGKPLEGDPSPALLNMMGQKIPPSYDDLTCVNDFVLLTLSWSYQMNYPATLQLMKTRGIVDSLSRFLPMHIDGVANVIDELNKMIEEKYVC